MLHFTCDLCGEPLGDRRYVVKLEVYPAYDPEEITEADLDVDHLQEVAELLDEMELTGQCPADNAALPQSFRYDLCPSCHRRYAADPLNRNAMTRLNYSEN